MYPSPPLECVCSAANDPRPGIVVTFCKITFQFYNKQANIDTPEERCFRSRIVFFRLSFFFKSPCFRISSLLLQYYLKSTPI